MKHAGCVITDSDGIQQETSILNVHCVAIRDTSNIEYTIKFGTTILSEPERESIYAKALYPFYNEPYKSNFPEQLKKLNDGKSAERIGEIINAYFNNRFST